MFSEIEKAYYKGLLEFRFWSYYWRLAIPAVIITIVVSELLHIGAHWVSLVMGIILLLLVIIFFVRDINTALVDAKAKPVSDIRAKLRIYHEADTERRLNNLLEDLKAHHCTSRDDIQLAFQYFEHQRPVRTRSGILEWVLSAAIGLASIVALAYNDEIHVVDFSKLAGILWPTIKIVLIVVLPIAIIGLIVSQVFFSRARIDSILVEDLAYIYVNFDKFKAKLK